MARDLHNPYEAFRAATPGQLAGWLKQNPFDGVDARDLALVGKIAKQCSYEEFHDFVESQEIPAVRLTDKEMERIKGGGFWSKLGRFFKQLVFPTITVEVVYSCAPAEPVLTDEGGDPYWGQLF